MSTAMTEIPFEVESAFVVSGRAYVMARALNPNAQFQVVESSTLGGNAIEVFVDRPRKLDEHGELRRDVFVFALRQPEALREFSEGDLVVLCAELVAGRGAMAPPFAKPEPRGDGQ